MKVVGITGGMASGKTTLARMLVAHGYVHCDADAIVHQLLREDQATIALIAAQFPQSLHAGIIDRTALSSIVAANPSALSALEAILHPRVVEEERQAIDAVKKRGGKGVVLDIPLLYETGAEKRCDVVIVAHAPEALRKARAFARPGMTEEKWQRLIARQLSDAERCRRADAVIATDGSEEQARQSLAAHMVELGL